MGRAQGRGDAGEPIVRRLNGEFRSKILEANVVGVRPPAIQGLGTGGGFSFWLQDRSGGSVEFLNQNLQKFLEAARKRPELANVNSVWRASVPQIYADINRDKVLKQGVAVGDVYQTLQAFLGGIYVNQFNRFGRQWKVFLQAEPSGRVKTEDINQFYVKNNDGQMVPLSAVVTTRGIAGPEFTNRFNLFRAAQVTGIPAPGYSSGQATDGARGGRRGDPAARDGLRLGRHVVPGDQGGGRRTRGSSSSRSSSSS